MELLGALLEGVVDRLTRPDYRAFEAQLRASGRSARRHGHPGIRDRASGVFATLTAPRFGAVHVHLLDGKDRPQRCRRRRDAPVCPHGRRARVSARPLDAYDAATGTGCGHVVDTNGGPNDSSDEGRTLKPPASQALLKSAPGRI